MRDQLIKQEKFKFRAVSPPWEHFDGCTPATSRCMTCGLPAHLAPMRGNECPHCSKTSSHQHPGR